MTHTDQAFIEAFQRAGGPATAEQPAAAPTAGQRRHTVHGPHLDLIGGKTPLTEAIALRMRQAAEPAAAAPAAATRLRSFAWPDVVERLAKQHRDEYLGLAPGAAAGGLVLGVAGIREGSGATTTALALARCLAADYGPVAVVDGQPEPPAHTEPLAAALGVLQTRTLTDAVHAEPRDAVIHAVDDRVSLVSAGPLDGAPTDYAAAAADLRRRHPIVLVDLGSVLEQPVPWSSATAKVVSVFAPVGVVIVRCESDLSGGVSTAQRVVESAGAAALGVIENFSARPVR